MRKMKAVLYATGLLVFSAVCAVAQPHEPPPFVALEDPPGQPQQPVQTPADTIYAFVFWLNAMNLRECAALVDGAQPDDELAKMQQQMGQEDGHLAVMIDEPRIEMVGDDKARVNVKTIVLNLRQRTVHRETSIDWLQLRLVGNLWKLVPDAVNAPPKHDGGHNFLQEAVTFIASPTRARSTARDKACQSNMRQLCLGMMQLTQDFDEKFDIKKMQEAQRENNQFAKWPVWVQAVMPYVKSLQLFRCPEDRDKGEGAVSYSFNENLEGVGLNKIERPADLVMLYEGKDGKLDFRHDGRATIGFADGHVKLVGEAEAKDLRWKP